MNTFSKLRRITLILFIALLLSGCDDLIIKDDGQVTLGLDDCDGVSFQILVKQSGKTNTNTTVKVEDGELEFDISKAKYDFGNNITVEVMAIGPGADDCGISGVLIFNGKAEPVGIGNRKISLSDFKKKP
ncbi:MAG: hypothetical protein GY710_03390 [Desulfobacteraceae bacterium]|nr:hypothetical protein [Desulfobacteraceae bacterium]